MLRPACSLGFRRLFPLSLVAAQCLRTSTFKANELNRPPSTLNMKRLSASGRMKLYIAPTLNRLRHKKLALAEIAAAFEENSHRPGTCAKKVLEHAAVILTCRVRV